MSSPSWLKKFSTNFKEENSWKKGFLKIMWKIMQLCEKLKTAYYMDALVSSIKVL